jgi:hypothetical protein
MFWSLARTGWNLRRRDGVSIQSHFLSFLSLFPAFAGGFDRYPAAPYPSLDRRTLAGRLWCARSSFHSRPLRARASPAVAASCRRNCVRDWPPRQVRFASAELRQGSHPADRRNGILRTQPTARRLTLAIARPVVAQRCYWRAGVRVCRSTNSQTVVVCLYLLCRTGKHRYQIRLELGALALKASEAEARPTPVEPGLLPRRHSLPHR